MSNKPTLDEDALFKDLDTSSDVITAAKKIPGGITGGVKPLADFMSIPCSKIIEYQDKEDSDFTPWPKDKFDELVESIKDSTIGLIDPVTVRAAKDKDGYYEMLAGEHRWKATIAAGIPSINAHLIRDCSDEKAKIIFSLTNTQRRENTLRDKINGWWHYMQATRFKRSNDIQILLSEGIIDEETALATKKSYRNAARYAKMHDLIDELINLAEQKHLSIRSGEQIAFIPKEKQQDLIPYKHNINDTSKATMLRRLANGEIEGKKWCPKEIENILFQKGLATKPSMKGVSAQVNEIIKSRLSKKYHPEAPNIISAALDMYLGAHPEYTKSLK